MTRTAAARLSARALLDLVRAHAPSVEAGELVFATDPPADLVASLSVLHTGIRALLTERRWWGSGTDRPLVVELNPSAPIPAGVGLLCVEGDPLWDRIHPVAPVDLPRLFDPDPTAGPSRRAVSGPRTGSRHDGRLS